MDRSWMWNRTDKNRHVRVEYVQGVEDFLNFAYSHESVVDEGKIRCPCTICKNRPLRARDDVKLHLVKNGFMRLYDRWSSHGEGLENNMFVEESSRAVQFFKLLDAAEEPLFDSCKTHTKLSAMCELFNIKSDYNMPQSCYDRVASMMKKLLPEGNSLPENFYKTKKELAKLGMEHEKIDACKNHCILYYKENKDLQECPICDHPRYKPSKSKSRKKIPYKVLHYLPLTPRLQRLYMSPNTAEQMTWHNKNHEKGKMGHPAHGEAWKNFNETHPSFSAEPRNVRIGLCTDGFTPFNNYGGNYSCWPVIITVYNLPPGMCMKEPYMFLTLVIPGPKGPGKSLDVYLRPLIDELKMLWGDGVETYDVSKKENFQMKVGLMWTISDFPAYAMLSGWSTHGRLACPYCMSRTNMAGNNAGLIVIANSCPHTIVLEKLLEISEKVTERRMRPRPVYQVTKFIDMFSNFQI